MPDAINARLLERRAEERLLPEEENEYWNRVSFGLTHSSSFPRVRLYTVMGLSGVVVGLRND